MLFIKLNIQRFAHVKAQGSTRNGRDSAGRRLGAKASDGQKVSSGSILYRQRGTKVHPGENVRRGNDDTLYTTVDGVVKFEHLGKDRKQVSCYPQK
jgi:large subunit ribosomal protein L27